jgi:hypothetical protein
MLNVDNLNIAQILKGTSTESLPGKMHQDIAQWEEGTIIKELGIMFKTIPIYCDNQGASFIASSPMQESRTKHIDIQYYYIHELIMEG